MTMQVRDPCAERRPRRKTGGMLGAATKGRLLVATPPLDDPNFDRAVVFVIEHDDDGALGVVLNRPIGADLPGPLERWEDRLTAPDCLFEGGPVETHALIALGHRTPAGAAEDEHQVSLTATISSVDLSVDPALVTGVESLRVFQGYSGWGANQLDAEIAAGGWIVLDAVDDDVFTSEPGRLWRQVLGRQPGRLSWLAAAPDDLSLN
ncbi:MAG: YqgE/AlgH family protein [Actinomycetota bacterium]|nr:YqgE/AlgH family protein [Actinomycetota bacterium]